MTNWEKSCVDALVSSPTAFALFKAKQRNKRHVDQYINTIWPYEIKKVNQGDRVEAATAYDVLDPILNFLSDLIDEGESGYVDRAYKFKREFTCSEILKALISLKNTPSWIAPSSIGEIVFCSSEDSISIEMNPSKNSNFIDLLIHRLKSVGSHVKYYKMVSDTSNERTGTTPAIKKLISYILKVKKQKKIINSSKFKRIYLGQNVGIEIEYEGVWQEYLEKELTKSRYAISFNSGIDGGGQDGSKYNNNSRLRENRLRINGHRGLNALHYLLEDMINSGCSITNKSGMHYHIDLTHLDEKKLDISVCDKFVAICNNNRIHSQLASIFEVTREGIVLDVLWPLIRYPTEFTTIEWRMGTPTFNFTKLTIQILCAIHVTNVLFGSKKTMDVEYLTHLAEIYKQINS